jgi:hypothetical protein
MEMQRQRRGLQTFALICDPYIIVLNINTISGSCRHP